MCYYFKTLQAEVVNHIPGESVLANYNTMLK